MSTPKSSRPQGKTRNRTRKKPTMLNDYKVENEDWIGIITNHFTREFEVYSGEICMWPFRAHAVILRRL